MVGWLFALLSYHSWVLFSSLTVTYVLYLNSKGAFFVPSPLAIPSALAYNNLDSCTRRMPL